MKRRLLTVLSILLVVPALGGCVDCGACVDAFTLTVILPNGGGPVTTDNPAITCGGSTDSRSYCSGQLTEGSYEVVVSAPGYESQTLSFSLGPPSGGGLSCAPCPDQHRDSISLVPEGSAPVDASLADGGF